MQFKESIYTACVLAINIKIKALENNLHELSESAASDNKSSAGDKHETARAMVQLEQEKISRQLDKVLAQQVILQKIDYSLKSEQIIKGSLIKTNKGYLFLSIALGKINVEGIDVIILSPQSPLGIKLIGLKVKSSVTINAVTYIIEEIF